MGHSYRIYLAGESLLTCRTCRNHLAVGESVLSKQFTGQHGKALLIRHAVNIYTGDPEERNMRTGRHTVRDVYCEVCHTVLGWKYDFAYEPDQKYKEGRFILEREMITEQPEKRGSYAVRPVISEVTGAPLLMRV